MTRRDSSTGGVIPVSEKYPLPVWQPAAGPPATASVRSAAWWAVSQAAASTASPRVPPGPDFEVQMRPGRHATAADITDVLASLYAVG